MSNDSKLCTENETRENQKRCMTAVCVFITFSCVVLGDEFLQVMVISGEAELLCLHFPS